MNFNLNKVFESGRDLERKDVLLSKYTMNAYKKDLDNYRIMTLGSIINKEWKNDIPDYIIEFLNDEGQVVSIANIVLNQVAQIQFRSLKEKKFTVLGRQTAVPYGIGQFSDDFKYGDWVVITEGTSDRDALIDIYPNTIAVLTSGLTTIQRQLIKNLTNKVILLYDNDKAGLDGMDKDSYILREKMGIKVETIDYIEDVEDPGTILEYKYEGKSFDAEHLESYFETWLRNIMG